MVGGAKRPKSASHHLQAGKNSKSSSAKVSSRFNVNQSKQNDGWGSKTAPASGRGSKAASSFMRNTKPVKPRRRRNQSWGVRRPNDGWDDIDKQREHRVVQEQKQRSLPNKGLDQQTVEPCQKSHSTFRAKMPKTSYTKKGWKDFTIPLPKQKGTRTSGKRFQTFLSNEGAKVKYDKFPVEDEEKGKSLKKERTEKIGKLESGLKQVTKNILRRGRKAKSRQHKDGSRKSSFRKAAGSAQLHQTPKPMKGYNFRNLIPPHSKASMGRFIVWEPWNHSCARHIKYGVNPVLLERWWKQIIEGCRWVNAASTSRAIPRMVCWFTSQGCKCVYKYSGVISKPIGYPKWLGDIAKTLMKVLGFDKKLQPPSCCNVNLYRNGNDCVGWHADDEPLFGGEKANTIILSLSLGQTRSFQVRLKNKDGPELVNLNNVLTTALEHGDILTMEGYFQRFYEHRVPPEPTNNQQRLNLTFRWIMKHSSICTLAR